MSEKLYDILELAFDRPPEQAIDYLKSQGIAITWDWQEAHEAVKRHAFTMAKVLSADALQTVKDGMVKAAENGTPFAEFNKGTLALLEQKGFKTRSDGSAWRLETAFRNGLQSMYSAGRETALWAAVDKFPWGEFVATRDRRTRPVHALLNGVVRRLTDPFWRDHTPPIGHRCRCRKRTYSDRQIKRLGLTPSSGDTVVNGNGEKIPIGDVKPDAGFGVHPGEHWKPDLSRYSPDIRAQVEKALSARPVPKTPTWSDEARLRQALAETEARIFTQRYESAAAYDSAGNEVLFKDGEEFYVAFSPEEIALLADTVFTHNHPRGWGFPENDPQRSGSSFSDSDISMACNAHLREIRAVSPRYIHVMRRPSGGWGAAYWRSTLGPTYRRIELDVHIEFLEAIEAGELTIEQANARHYHEIWTRVTAELGIPYLRVEHSYK